GSRSDGKRLPAEPEGDGKRLPTGLNRSVCPSPAMLKTHPERRYQNVTRHPRPGRWPGGAGNDPGSAGGPKTRPNPAMPGPRHVVGGVTAGKRVRNPPVGNMNRP